MWKDVFRCMRHGQQFETREKWSLKRVADDGLKEEDDSSSTFPQKSLFPPSQMLMIQIYISIEETTAVLTKYKLGNEIALQKSPFFSICLHNLFPVVKRATAYETDLKPPAVYMHFLFDPIYI